MILRQGGRRQRESAPGAGSGKPQPGAAGPGGQPRRRPLALAIYGVLAVLVVAGAGFAAFSVYHRASQTASGQPPRASGIPAGISTRLANLMQLSALPGPAAPGFRLTDQHGRTMPLSSFRGKVVVLEFMDPHCTDICPIVSKEYEVAYRDLGAAAGKVVFAAINVNQYFASVRAMAAYSDDNRLNTIPGWHFFTGPVPALRTAWHDYYIQVQAPDPKADIVHTSAVYFIDPRGRERYLASPEADHTKSGSSYLPASQQAAWGHGIAVLARSLAG